MNRLVDRNDPKWIWAIQYYYKKTDPRRKPGDYSYVGEAVFAYQQVPEYEVDIFKKLYGDLHFIHLKEPSKSFKILEKDR